MLKFFGTHPKTTITGLTLMAGALVNLYFNHATAEMVTASVTAFLGGLGLIFSADGNGGNVGTPGTGKTE